MFNAKVIIQELIFRTRRDILIKVEIKDKKKSSFGTLFCETFYVSSIYAILSIV